MLQLRPNYTYAPPFYSSKPHSSSPTLTLCLSLTDTHTQLSLSLSLNAAFSLSKKSTTLSLSHSHTYIMEMPEIYMGGYFGGAGGAGQYSPEKQKTTEHFTVDDLLDFSNEDAVMADGFLDNVTANSTDSSTVTAVDSCNSGSRPHFSACIGSRSFADSQFSGDLCVPVIPQIFDFFFLNFKVSISLFEIRSQKNI